MTQLLTTEQLLEKIKTFHWKRQITKIHPHHTAAPSHKDFNGSNGLQLHNNMRNYHINVRKFNDIAQHLTLLPNGLWIIGRDWNTNPASHTGNNTGAFMVEAVGNFNKGVDKLEGKQLDSYIKWCAFCLEFFKLPLSAIQFHRDTPGNSTDCPGTGISKEWFINLVQQEINKQKAGDLVSKYFTDVINDKEAIEAIDTLYEKGIINGIGNNKFNPEGTVTRKQCALMMKRLLDYVEQRGGK